VGISTPENDSLQDRNQDRDRRSDRHDAKPESLGLLLSGLNQQVILRRSKFQLPNPLLKPIKSLCVTNQPIAIL
jgi:hypothetical protein